MNIVFFGSGAFGLPALEALERSQHKILEVISQPDRPAGRGGKLTPTPVSLWAMGKGLPVTRTDSAGGPDMVGHLRALAADCLVVIAFGQKLSDEVLGTARLGGINLHSSLLPKYRGAAPINWAILNNERETGVSVIAVTNVMDGGDIFGQLRTPIGETETAGELHDRLAELGAPLVVKVLDDLAGGKVNREKQNAALKSGAPKLGREMAWVDFGKSADEVSARIRGLSPWPGVECELIDAEGKPRVAFKILKCRAVGSGETQMAVPGAVVGEKNIACGTGAIELLVVQPVGKKAMDGAAFANGYGVKKGCRVKGNVKCEL